ncbi:MAG TPA: hypothetical protein VNY04_10970, partial [Chthoniobacterales bacterium]|nr:hypothetical protein [Chthoniobacterales bacterium]
MPIAAAENALISPEGTLRSTEAMTIWEKQKLKLLPKKESSFVRDASAALTPSFLFDLDGTLVDSVFQHVLAWREALEQ